MRIREGGLDEALARAADGVFAVGLDGRIILWNRAAERILGYCAREALGRPCCDLFLGRDERGNRLCYRGCHVMQLVRMGEAVQNFDMLTQTKAGCPIWLNVSILVVPAAERDGDITIHFFRDVTAAKDLLALVRQQLAPPAEPQGMPNAAATLTRREIEVLRLMSTGASTKVLAENLRVSPVTVRNHVQNLLDKLGVHSRLEAVAYAIRHRLL